MARPGPPPNPRGRLKPRLQVKCTEEYDRWARDLAESDQLDAAELIAAALAEYARKKKFRPPPART